MIRIGTAPYLECSSAGNIVFSAFYARPVILKGRSIEDAYQRMRTSENLESCYATCVSWWYEWVDEHNLGGLLTRATGLSDCLSPPRHPSPAFILWDIRTDLIKFPAYSSAFQP